MLLLGPYRLCSVSYLRNVFLFVRALGWHRDRWVWTQAALGCWCGRRGQGTPWLRACLLLQESRAPGFLTWFPESGLRYRHAGGVRLPENSGRWEDPPGTTTQSRNADQVRAPSPALCAECPPACACRKYL